MYDILWSNPVEDTGWTKLWTTTRRRVQASGAQQSTIRHPSSVCIKYKTLGLLGCLCLTCAKCSYEACNSDTRRLYGNRDTIDITSLMKVFSAILEYESNVLNIHLVAQLQLHGRVPPSCRRSTESWAFRLHICYLRCLTA